MSEKQQQLRPQQSHTTLRSNIDRQTDIMATLKLRRIIEVNQRLRKDLSRERIYASNACLSIIRFTQNTKDLCIPSLWGYLSDDDEDDEDGNSKKHRQECCTIM